MAKQKTRPLRDGTLKFPRYHPICPPEADRSSRAPTCPIVGNGRQARPSLLAPRVQKGFSWQLRRDFRISSAYLLSPYQARFTPTPIYSSPSQLFTVQSITMKFLCQYDRSLPPCLFYLTVLWQYVVHQQTRYHQEANDEIREARREYRRKKSSR